MISSGTVSTAYTVLSDTGAPRACGTHAICDEPVRALRRYPRTPCDSPTAPTSLHLALGDALAAVIALDHVMGERKTTRVRTPTLSDFAAAKRSRERVSLPTRHSRARLRVKARVLSNAPGCLIRTAHLLWLASWAQWRVATSLTNSWSGKGSL